VAISLDCFVASLLAMTVEEYVIAGMGKGFENGEGVKIAIGNKIEVFSNQGVEKEVSCLLKKCIL